MQSQCAVKPMLDETQIVESCLSGQQALDQICRAIIISAMIQKDGLQSVTEEHRPRIDRIMNIIR